MPLAGFYDENTGRAYPLVTYSNLPLGQAVFPVPPSDTLLDFGCMVGLDAEYDSGQHTVYLFEITRAGALFTFDFRSDAPGLLGYALQFHRSLADVEYTTGYAVAVPLGGPQGPQELIWEGFLVTGPLDSLAALMPVDETLAIVHNPRVEPALVQNLGMSYVRTINLANQDRTHATPPPGCPGGDQPGTDYGYLINAVGLTGDLRFKEGYNVAIRQDARNNALTFLALVAAGEGVPCAEVPLYPGEPSPDGGSLLTGGPACGETISSINGLTASVIRLVAGLGTVIVPSPDASALIVDFDRHDMTVCGPVTVIVEDLEEELTDG